MTIAAALLIGFVSGFITGAAVVWRERRAQHGDIEQPNFLED